MKKLLVLAALFFSVSAFAAKVEPSAVNDKVLHTFNKVFKDASDVTWTENKKNVEANFMVNEVKVKAFLDHKGRLLRTIRYYSERHLPPNVRYQLHKNYSDMEVWGVTELSNSNELYYYVTLRDNKNWYKVGTDATCNFEMLSVYKRGEPRD